MSNLSDVSIPQELISNKNILEAINSLDLELDSPVKITRDVSGRVNSASFYNVDNELYKQIFFDGSIITGIDFYKNDKLSRKDIYDNAGYLISKYLYRKDGSCACEIHYDYDLQHKISAIVKKTLHKDIRVEYSYDCLDRIISRSIYLNKRLLTCQQYGYDVLDRVIKYQDENQKISVNSFGSKNELLSYTITDKIDNEIIVTNHFTAAGYVDTVFTVKGSSSTVKNTSYVDNVMLKQPFSGEDDLDLIISGLCASSTIHVTRPDDVSTKNSINLIDKNIEMRALPISIRKRVLYNIAVKSKV